MDKRQLLLIGIVTFLAFFRIGEHPIQDWDESRHGVNAIEMLNNGDWVNLYYEGRVDDWNLKPPLAIWTIAVSYSIFGLNEFGLRFPSALAMLFAFLFLYKFICLYESKKFAFFTCLILASVKGWIGYHIGRTGDTDALFVAMLMGGIYCLSKFLDFKPKSSLYFSAIFFGLAFFTKGFAVFIIVPSIFLYIILTYRFREFFSNKHTYQALGLFTLFPLSWFLINSYYGVSFSEKEGLGSNAFYSMFLYDIVERFSNPTFENPLDPYSKFFVITYLDARFNVWNYFLYLGILLAIIGYSKGDFKLEKLKVKLKLPLILASFCWIIPLYVFQSFITVQHHWYLAPSLPFIAILTYTLIEWIIKKYAIFKYLFFIALVFTLIRQLILFNSPPDKPEIVNRDLLITESRMFNFTSNLKPSLLLDLYHINRHQKFIGIQNFKEEAKVGDMIFIRKNEVEEKLSDINIETLICSNKENWCIFQIINSKSNNSNSE